MKTFENMRRKDRAMPEEQARKLLENGEWGTLSTVGEDGWPYATPLSYVVMENRIYFHAAKSGKKMKNLAHQPNVCFCTVGATQPVFSQDFTTEYESVVVFGQAREVTDENVKRRALLRLCEKYLPQHMDKAEASIQKSFGITAVWEIEIMHCTGKQKLIRNK